MLDRLEGVLCRHPLIPKAQVLFWVGTLEEIAREYLEIGRGYAKEIAARDAVIAVLKHHGYAIVPQAQDEESSQ